MKPELIVGEDCAVAVVHGRDYILDASGDSDASGVLQKMIDSCHALGGGVAYLPEGRYALHTPVVIRKGVTLRGERDGTVLCCYHGKNEEDGEPQIVMEACTGLTDLTLYYPEQDFTKPVPYAPTVRQRGIDSITLRNVTMVNPWRGVQCGSDGNELHYLKNVGMTPLHTGVFMDKTTDIGRLENLRISPEYLERFLSLSDDDRRKLREYMLQNVTGVFMARSDWEYVYDVFIEGCKIGFLITSLEVGAPNAQICRLNMHNCVTGFRLINVNPYGVALSDSTITADIGGVTAAVVSEASFRTVMQLNGVDISGYENAVVHEGPGHLSFVHCTFGGGAVLNKKGSLFISDETLDWPAAPRGGHKPYPHSLNPAAHLYVVTDFGAAGDGETDDTGAFQKALNRAGETGGIVYVPAGLYRFDGSLTVPVNVELRGARDVPCHTMGGGSVLQPYGGKNGEDGTPFITLLKGAGVRGVLINHPEQDPVEPIRYPWAIQARGERCYCIDTVFVNSWLGLDFGTYGSRDHYISYISGAPIRCGVFIGNNPGEGWIENVQYNPHYWYRSDLPGTPGRGTWKAFWHNQIKYLDALKFGYNEQVHLLGTFVFAAKHGLLFAGQDGRGTKGTFIGHGTDGGEQGMCVDGFAEVDLINTELVTIESPDTRIYINITENAKGKTVLHNTLMWGRPDFAVVVRGGDTVLQQINYVDQGQIANTVHAGKLTVNGAYFWRRDNHLAKNGGEACLSGSTIR
jgi:hypothetical protein